MRDSNSRLSPKDPYLCWLITRANDRELARQVQYLKAENKVLRGNLPERITVTPQGSLSRATVCRSLAAMVQAGVLKQVTFNDHDVLVLAAAED